MYPNPGDLPRLSGEEWYSVAQYVVRVSASAGLVEIGSDRINSFPLARLGCDRLIRQKQITADLLEGNLSKLERYVGERRKTLEGHQLVVIRSIWRQSKAALEAVNDHISEAQKWKSYSRQGYEEQVVFGEDKAEADEDLF